MTKNEEKLRYLLWLTHGCSTLYGDDGEMQCGSCVIDFKRDSVESIEDSFITRGLKNYKEWNENNNSRK